MSTEPSVFFDRQRWRNLLLSAQTSDEDALAWIGGQTREGLEKLAEGDGLTPLMAAAKEGKAAWVAALLPISDPLAQNYPEKLDALSMAARNGHADVVRLLEPVSNLRAIEHWADRTALMFAATEGKDACVEILAKNSDLSQRDSRGYTPLMLACSVGRPLCVQWLAHAQTAKDTHLDSQETPLMMLARNSMNATKDLMACAQFVLPHSDLSAVDCEGKNALRIAIEKGRFPLASEIAKHMDLAQEDARWSALDSLCAYDLGFANRPVVGRREFALTLGLALSAKGQKEQLSRLEGAFELHVTVCRWDCAEGLSPWASQEGLRRASAEHRADKEQTSIANPRTPIPRIEALLERFELQEAAAEAKIGCQSDTGAPEGEFRAKSASGGAEPRKGSPRL